MIKIGKTPQIVEIFDDFGSSTGKFRVECQVGYISEELWRDLQEFQSYSMSREPTFQNQNVLVFTDDEIEAQVPEMTRLIKRAGGNVWHFNMVQPQKHGYNNFASCTAVLGKRTLKRWTWVDDLKLALLRLKTSMMSYPIQF
jgi:hypothetical protein